MPFRRPLILVLLLAGCGLFEPRVPEAPVLEGGTYVQPDTPDRVVDNLTEAVREANAGNYRRSLDDGFTFRPTAAVQATDIAYWGTWGRPEEEGYFAALVAALQPGATPTLTLSDEALVYLSDDRYTFEARYRLAVPHRRTDAPTVVEGRLVWEIVQRSDGLWRLAGWADEAVDGVPAWSDLKVAFGR